MAVRVPIRIEREGRGRGQAVETVAVANSGFEAAEPELLLPVRVAERLGLWPPPPSAHAEPFESPGAAFSMLSVKRALRVTLPGARVRVVAHAVVAERETEVVLDDHLVEALGIEIVAAGRGRYRIGPRGRVRDSTPPEHW